MNAKYIIFAIFFTFGIFNLLCPKLRNFTQKYFKKIGNFLSKITLYAGYILIVLPVGLLNKICKRDRLCLKNNKTTYWVDASKHDLERQF